LSPVLMTRLDSDANNAALRENAVKKGTLMANVIFDQHDVVWRSDVMSKAGKELRQMMRSAKPAILVDPDSKIVAANGAWRSLCGYPGDKAINESPKVLHGPATDKTKATDFASSLLRAGSARMTIVNYTRLGAPFCHRIHCERRQGAQGSYYLTCSNEVTNTAIRRAMIGAHAPDIERNTKIMSIAVAFLLTSLIIRSEVATNFRMRDELMAPLLQPIASLVPHVLAILDTHMHEGTLLAVFCASLFAPLISWIVHARPAKRVAGRLLEIPIAAFILLPLVLLPYLSSHEDVTGPSSATCTPFRAAMAGCSSSRLHGLHPLNPTCTFFHMAGCYQLGVGNLESYMLSPTYILDRSQIG